MSLLAERSKIKEDKSNIITLGIKAKEAKQKDPSVINATIGMLYDETGKLFTFQSVDQALNSLSTEEKYAYSSTPGNSDYHEALKRWIFRSHYEEILSELYCSVMATPGGSGAISNTFSNYLNPKDYVLLPEYMWGNYKQFAYENFAEYDTYTMFDGDHFNLENIKEKITTLKRLQNRIVLVINDPCHNPTGYTMTPEEWVELINIINSASQDGTPFILLYDMAYIDYDKRGFEATRNNILLFKKLNPSVLTILAFSGSKSLALYGLRIGAQIALSRDKKNIDEFFQANKFSSRAKWSTATNLGMNIVARVLLNENYRSTFEEELKSSSKMLTTRATTFLEECKKNNLPTLPFSCGYFITIPCSNPDAVYHKLIQKGIHVIPLDTVLRVTIAAITLENCKKLPKLIKEALTE